MSDEYPMIYRVWTIIKWYKMMAVHQPCFLLDTFGSVIFFCAWLFFCKTNPPISKGVIRDIPEVSIVAGNSLTNLRQAIFAPWRYWHGLFPGRLRTFLLFRHVEESKFKMRTTSIEFAVRFVCTRKLYWKITSASQNRTCHSLVKEVLKSRGQCCRCIRCREALGFEVKAV